MRQSLQRVLAASPARVLVIGDLILDEALHGDVTRLSPESPVPVLRPERSVYALGGAANVANNLAALGCEVDLCGAVGDDAAGRRLRELIAVSGVRPVAVVDVPGYVTTHKTRVIANGQHVLRIDREVTSVNDEALIRSGLEGLEWRYDAVVCSDYDKGVLTPRLLSVLTEATHQADVAVMIDPKGAGYERYRGAHLLTPNLGELARATGMEIHGTADPSLADAAATVLSQTGAAAVLVTCGREGLVLCRPGIEPLHLPTAAREVFDITGAGDTVVAILTTALCAGVSLERAAQLANVGAGLVVGKLGTATVSRGELIAAVNRRAHPRGGKIIDDLELARVAADARARGDVVVCTNGCFELLHAGHVAYLEAARAHGDLLIVGVNSDASVRRIKGERRPLVPQGERAAVLSAFECVDYVAFFDEDTPARFVERVLPDVLVKGADWPLDRIVGREFVEARGGRVERIPLVPGSSTSRIIETVLARYTPPTVTDE